MAECRHEIEETTCGICRPRVTEPRTSRPDDAWGSWFIARYSSDCAGCDEPIDPGDQIRSDGQRGWLCTRCGGGTGMTTIAVAGGML
jgi:hypothetical protein